ncbi:MAG TPA: nucleotidyltransferase domain-containing protein, partial [Thermoanaerobaculia bacterium]|nr:nucleotidyltransferase domain-containing protein [Thermoanaerobaculia bacterium]
MLLASVISGCAIGQTHTYTYEPPATTPAGKGTVVLFAVRDERADVVAGAEPSAWVGEQRDGWGIPHSVVTTDGRPFAAIVQEAVQRDLERTGLAVVVAQEVPATAVGIAELLRSHGATRALGVTIADFNANTYSNIDVEWDFAARVFDGAGGTVATDRLQGKETLEAAVRGSIRAAKMQVPPFFYRLVHELVIANPAHLAGAGGRGGGWRARAQVHGRAGPQDERGWTERRARARGLRLDRPRRLSPARPRLARQSPRPPMASADGTLLPMPSIAEIGEAIASTLASRSEVVGAYLFGSRVDGSAHPQSDVDVGVLSREPFGLEILVELENGLEGRLGLPVDVVDLWTANAFLALAAVKGERVFERAPPALDEFDLYVLRRAGDLAHFER